MILDGILDGFCWNLDGVLDGNLPEMSQKISGTFRAESHFVPEKFCDIARRNGILSEKGSVTLLAERHFVPDFFWHISG